MSRADPLSESQYSDEIGVAVIPGDRTPTSGVERMQGQSFHTLLTHREVPASPFERLASFIPEKYTILDNVQSLFGYQNRELQATEYSRINQYAMFYANVPRRKWTRLTVLITTTVESKYWSTDKVKASDALSKTSQQMPASLISEVSNFLRSYQDVQQDSHLSIFLGNQTEREMSGKEAKFPVRFSKPPFQAKAYLQNITSRVYHWNCPRYYEKDLTQQPLYIHRPTNHFVAFLQSRWVLEYRFGSDKAQIDGTLYMLEVLHGLKGKPGINPFIGVVLDDDTSVITAFLCEMPAKGKLFHILRNCGNSDELVTWERRGKWCRQIVQSVTEMHSQTKVVGSLGQSPDCAFAVDSNDNAVLYKQFGRCFPNERLQEGKIPPEHRHLHPFGTSIEAVPQTDLFQLGLQLWQIAANQNTALRLRFCRGAGCITKVDETCTEPHADPIQLPSPGEDTPQYLIDIITACRAENPDERPPAWKLLQMFPSIAEDKGELTGKGPSLVACEGTSHHLGPRDDSKALGTTKELTRIIYASTESPATCLPNHLTRLEECIERFHSTIACDICGDQATRHYFHCKICRSSDFDMCVSCFNEGIHCFDSSHYLQEFSNDHWTERYYTSVKQDGRRAVVTL